jgi:hypothetical protein
VPGPGNRRVYPTLQFGEAGALLPGLARVQKALAFESPWSVLHFLVTPNEWLDGDVPALRLRAGKVDAVVAAAARSGSMAES